VGYDAGAAPSLVLRSRHSPSTAWYPAGDKSGAGPCQEPPGQRTFSIGSVASFSGVNPPRKLPKLRGCSAGLGGTKFAPWKLLKRFSSVTDLKLSLAWKFTGPPRGRNEPLLISDGNGISACLGPPGSPGPRRRRSSATLFPGPKPLEMGVGMRARGSDRLHNALTSAPRPEPLLPPRSRAGAI
jgi:hypothetical protein